MHSSIVLLSAFVASTIASPVGKRSENAAFTVPQISAGFTVKQAPAISMLQTYAKYSSAGAVAPAVVVDAASSAQQTGTVSAAPETWDEAYLCQVTLGGQTLALDFDTGSADLWVFSTLMPSSESSGHTLYNGSISGTLESGESWSIGYGDGSTASGVVYADKVVVGSVTATSQAVEAATSASSAFVSDTASDGLLGLAMSTLNTVSPTQQTTFFDTVKSSLASPLFTVDLKKGEAGSYDFGFIDSSKYTGDITYVNVNSGSGFWEFTASGYAVGNGSINATSFTAIADTGTTLLYIPEAAVTAYYADLTGSQYASNVGGWIFPCATTPPDFTAIIGGSIFTVPGPYIDYGPISSTMCFGGIQSDAGIGFSIFGDIFLKSQFVIFSEVGGVAQLGFAAQSSIVGTSAAESEWYLECDGTATNDLA